MKTMISVLALASLLAICTKSIMKSSMDDAPFAADEVLWGGLWWGL